MTVRGREPSGPDEVALGAETLSEADADIGEVVSIQHRGRERRLRVVGVVVLPVPALGGSNSRGVVPVLGGSNSRGVAMSMAAAESIGFGSCDGTANCSRVYALTAAPGTDVDAAAAPHLTSEESLVLSPPSPPAAVERLSAVSSLPWVLAAFLGLLGAATVAHSAATSGRRRRRDLAVLAVFGFTGSQLRATLATQVLAPTLLGIVVGWVIGVIGGGRVWALIAGAVPLPVVIDAPLAALLGVPIAATALASVATIITRWAASGLRPVTVLRGE